MVLGLMVIIVTKLRSFEFDTYDGQVVRVELAPAMMGDRGGFLVELPREFIVSENGEPWYTFEAHYGLNRLVQHLQTTVDGKRIKARGAVYRSLLDLMIRST